MAYNLVLGVLVNKVSLQHGVILGGHCAFFHSTRNPIKNLESSAALVLIQFTARTILFLSIPIA
jgi:hypothetical protein